MKEKIARIIYICSSLIVSCAPTTIPYGSNIVEGKDQKKIESIKVILSIPDWALGKYLTDEKPLPCSHLENLKALRGFDNVLYKTLLEKHPLGKYILTKKYNPCCPCSGSGSSCCRCLQSMVFASPSLMQTSVKNAKDGSDLTKDTQQGMDFFTIPQNAPADSLIIDGKGIGAPLKFVMDGV